MQTKIFLLIDTRDRLYTKKLADYLKKYYSDTMEVFTNMTGLAGKDESRIVLLSDYRDPKMETWAELALKLSRENGIDPYQSARDIADQILEAWKQHLLEKEKKATEAAANASLVKAPEQEKPKAFLKNENETVRLEKKSGRGLIGVFGPGGGIGKTTFTLALALALGEFLTDEDKVLVISLTGFPAQVEEMHPSQDMLLHLPQTNQRRTEHRHSLGSLCFSLSEENEKKTKERLGEIVQPMGRGWERLDYIDAPLLLDDLWEMEEGDLSRMLRYLKEIYPYVLADLGSMPIRPVRQMLRESDRRLYTAEATAEGRTVFDRICPALEEKDLLVLIQSLRLEGKAKMNQDRFESLRPGELWLPRQSQLYTKEGGLWRLKRSGPYFEHVREIAGFLR